MPAGRPPRDGSRPLLSLGDVLDAALRISEGRRLEDLTIQAVATELKVTAPAIYYYVNSRSELVERVAEHAVATIVVEQPAGQSWHDRLRAVLRSIHATLNRHPGVSEYWLRIHADDSAGWAHARVVVDLLREGGFPPDQAVAAFHILHNYVAGSLATTAVIEVDVDPASEEVQLRVVPLPLAHTERRAELFDDGIDVLLDALRLSSSSSRGS